MAGPGGGATLMPTTNRRIVFMLVIAATAVCNRSVAGQRPAWPTLAPRQRYADSLPNASLLPIAMTVAAAEAEGRLWPRRPEGCTQIVSECTYYFADATPRTCTQTGSAPTVRSGEIVVGGNSVSPVGSQRIWWVPMHPATGDSLVIRATLPASPADTVRFTMPEWSRGLPDGEFYWLTKFLWPKAGHWLVVATSGSDWGCFIL